MPDYVIQPGDNPWALAEKLYGEGRWAIEILRQNAGASWVGGTVIHIPDQGTVKELQDSGFKPLITNAQASYLATGMQNFGTTPFDKFGNPTGSVPSMGGGGANTGGTGVGSTLGFANGRTLVTNPADRVRTEYGLPTFSPQSTAAAGALGGAKGTRRVAGQRVSPGASGMSTGTLPTTPSSASIPESDLAMRGRGMGRATERTAPVSGKSMITRAGEWLAEQVTGPARAVGDVIKYTAQNKALPPMRDISLPQRTQQPTVAQPQAQPSSYSYPGAAPSGATAKLDELYNAMESMTPPNTITTKDVEDLFQNYYRTTIDPTTGAPVTITRQQFARAMEGMGYTLDLTSRTWTRGSETEELPDLLETPAGTAESGMFNLFDTPVWYSAISRMLSQSSGGGGGSSTGRSDTSMPYYAKVGGTTWNTGR